MPTKFVERRTTGVRFSGSAPPPGHSDIAVDGTTGQLKWNDGSGNVNVAAGASAGSTGTVTQATSKVTGVTLSKLSGQITTAADALGAGAEAAFIVTNTLVGAKDVPVVAIKSGPATDGTYLLTVGTVTAGTFSITISNCSAGSLSEALVINFVIIPGS